MRKSNLDDLRDALGEAFERGNLGDPTHALVVTLHSHTADGQEFNEGHNPQAHLAVLPTQEAFSDLGNREQQGVAHILRQLADSLDPQRNLPDDTQMLSHLDPAIMQRFRDEGLLWLVNTSVLHPRGWALAVQVDDTGEPESLGVYRFGEYTIFGSDSAQEGLEKFQAAEWEREGSAKAREEAGEPPEFDG